jgi:Putative Ig domain/Regulator of chromosome condensation (RCC1) repeat
VAAGVSPATTVSVLSDPAIATTSLPRASVGRPYSATLVATSGLAPYSWSLALGTLPAGLSLSPAGLISGTPTARGTTALTFTVVDAAGEPVVKSLDLVVTPPYGSVWAWGFNSYGLGDGVTPKQSTVPVAVAGLTTATAVATGGQTSYALLVDGTVWGWGDNDYGGLANGGSAFSAVPVQVPGLTDVTAIAAGLYGGYALRGDGTVWAWGGNANGQVGDGTTIDRHSVVQVPGLLRVTAIAASGAQGFALLDDGTVWSWGSDEENELGDSAGLERHSPAEIVTLTGVTGLGSYGEGDAIYAVLSSGRLAVWGDTVSGTVTQPGLVPGLADVTAVAASSADGYALRSDGSVWGWGDNFYGQLANVGAGTGIVAVPVEAFGVSGVVAVGAANGVGYGVESDGSVWAWGDDEFGQLGDAGGAVTSSQVPLEVAGLTGVSAVVGAQRYVLALQTR